MTINPTYDYEATIVNVVDGDTIDVLVDLGFYLRLDRRVRVWGMNSREVHSTDAAEKALGLADKDFASAMIPTGTRVKIRSHKANTPDDKFGRWLAEIVLPDGRDFAAVMIASGHGFVYSGQGPKPTA